MKIIVNKSQNIAKALVHSLTKVVGLPESSVQLGDFTAVTTADGEVYKGLMAVISAVRRDAAAKAHTAFLSGSTADEKYLINQWVGIAAVLTAADKEAAGTTLQEVAHVMENFQLNSGFLAGTPKASIADVLVYGAVHDGRESLVSIVPASVMEWSARAHDDSAVAPIRCEHVKAAAKPAKAKTAAGGANGGAAATSAFTKPNEEEIQRRRLEKEKAKAEKEAAKAAAAASGAAPQEKHDDPNAKKGGKKAVVELSAAALDVRVGKFVNVRAHPEADRLYVEDMDLGTETRTIVSGLVEHFKDPKDLDGKLILVVCNMKPKPLKGVTSHGMILCASNEEGLSLVSPPAGAVPGDRIFFGDAFAEAGEAPEVLSGNKMTDVLSHLHTNGEGVLCWKEVPAHHAKGIIAVPTKKNCIVK